MSEIFFKTLPFFLLIVLGYTSGKKNFFSHGATVYLAKFVFYFALSAMLFKFAAFVNLAEFLKWEIVFSYFLATGLIYFLGLMLSLYLSKSLSEAAVEAQCCAIGNVGFLGIPMLSLLMGPNAVSYVVLVLAVDLLVFGTLIIILIICAQEGILKLEISRTVTIGLIKNPMIISLTLGFLWSAMGIPIPQAMNEFLSLLGGAATPCALFAIGASLAHRKTENFSSIVWVSAFKLVFHPFAVALSAIYIFGLDPFACAVMVMASALPVAGNIYIIAQNYRVTPERVSASIFVSTAFSIVTVTITLKLIETIF